MRSLIKSIYHRLTGPIYRRLLAQLSTRLDKDLQTNLHYQERLTKKLAGEITQLRNLVQAQNEYLSSLQSNGLQVLLAHKPREQWSDEAVAAAVADLNNGMEPSMAAKKHHIPADIIIDWSARYGEMNAGAVQLIRQLENENAILRTEVARGSGTLNAASVASIGK